MNKKEFAKTLFEKGVFVSKADAERKLDTILGTVEEILQNGGDLNFIGWGKLEVVQKPERTGRNPKTGEEIKIEAKKGIKFKAGKTLLDKVN